nr:MAG TPA: hypothetical protein [Caudoviricetes sp.]DAL94056.1 MAG TPA: hypothetical protein [Caudoviricetes sp.]
MYFDSYCCLKVNLDRLAFSILFRRKINGN